MLFRSLKANSDDLIDLTELAYGGKFPGIYSSMGLLDETIRLFLWQLELPHEKVMELEGRLGGEDDHEQITLRLVPFEDVWLKFPDPKTLCSIFLYQQLKSNGKL